MPLAVTHVLVPIIALELLRDRYRKISKFFSIEHVFLIGVAGLLPDSDLLLYRITHLLGKPLLSDDLGHRVIFHNIWIPVGFLVFYMLFNNAHRFVDVKKRTKKYLQSFGKIYLVLFMGFAVHLILDAVLTGHVMPFYPLNSHMVDWNLFGKISSSTGIPILTITVSTDALLLLFWLWHQQIEKHILDYF